MNWLRIQVLRIKRKLYYTYRNVLSLPNCILATLIELSFNSGVKQNNRLAYWSKLLQRMCLAVNLFNPWIETKFNERSENTIW